MSSVSDLVSEYYSVRTALVASLAWATYDYILNIDNEVEYVWLRPWSFSTLLYFWTRYAGMVIMAVILAASIVDSQPRIVCNLVIAFSAWGGIATMTTVSVIMILRVWAMYGGNKRMLILLCSLLTILVTSECTIFGLAQVKANSSPIPLPPLAYLETGLNACYSISMPPMFIGIWISRLIFDFILFGLTLNKAWTQYREGWTSGLVDLLIRDNVLAFGLVFFIQISNLLITRFGKGGNSALGVGFALASDVTVGSRLLLHTRQVVYQRQPGGYDSDAPDAQLSGLRVQPPSRLAFRRTGSLSFLDDLDDDHISLKDETEEQDEEPAPGLV